MKMFLIFELLIWKTSDINYIQVDCSLPGSYVNGILQARILEWAAIPFSRDTNGEKSITRKVPIIQVYQFTAFCHSCFIHSPIPHLKTITSFSSVSQLCPTLWDPMNRSMLGLPVHHQLLEFTQTHVHRVGDAILCHSLLLLPPIPPSIRVFSNESTLHMRWPKYWSFSFSISPSNEHPGLISFRMDWLDLLAVQGTLKSLLQHHSSKGLILRRSAFFTVQLSHPYMTTGKTIALTRQIFVGKVMSLLFNTLSRLVITFWSHPK